MERSGDIGIIGGGTIGLSIAWQALRTGREVTLFERDELGQGSSRVAAGMLAPEAEVDFGEEEVMKLGQRSLSLYPRFLEELSEDVEGVPSLDRCGTLLVGKDRDDAEHLKRIHAFREELGLDVEWWGSSRAREVCDALSPRISSAIWLPEDARIDNVRLLKALAAAVRKKGVELKEHREVDAYWKEGDRWWVKSGEERWDFRELVLAAGAWSQRIEGVGREGPSLYPVKGQILTLGPLEGGNPDRMLRSPRVYLVPLEDGSLRVGGTSEERGFESYPSAGGMRELLEEAWELVPGVQESAFRSVDVGLRPAHREHRPTIGRASNGLLYATGHYRHGILLTPLTAYAFAELFSKGEVEDPLAISLAPS